MTTSTLPDLSGLTILVVEDDPDGLEALATILTACGARVVTAMDTLAAREHVRNAAGQLSLVITDLGLPGETGAAFLSWLRLQPTDKGGRVTAVAMTGYPKDFPALQLGGFAAYFQKPLDLDNVCATIAAMLPPSTRR